ncbi:putative alternative thymidylate synthase [Candidatus Protochlamydia naegleriophila]|uniref:Putative alternative thymidylate synthase n=1 Tax=Candidatus Protochlamydia naegleriophila TaxID=389348 RepID=A0A0U5K103_9BACT|nr:FAD-dependent thymidylate synthase [Candidatus Protochlamydia naegleriophila]CUI15787.1 putative alternative thymidylate synthase [Candidatus Protochlamydia naegleriophila]
MLTDDYEEFTEAQIKILKRYVTNTSSHVFVLRNLPEVIKGALFSRYSRSSLGLRSLLLKEFIANNEEAAFEAIVGPSSKNEEELQAHQAEAIKKAQAFYDRILDGYGDDSIGELGGAHLAIENISMIAAKLIEDQRIGGSPLEKSTRYIYFDQKVNGEYLFYREPILMTSAYRDSYIQTCNMLFDTYSRLIPPMTAIIEQRFPKDPSISKAAYTAALRAKVLDCLRGLLPAGTLTNMGIYGNGRFFEHLIHKLNCQNLAELQDIGKRSYQELAKVIPSFVRRSDPAHRTHQSYAQFSETMNSELKLIAEQHLDRCERSLQSGVRLVSHDPEAVTKVAAAMLFSNGNKGLPEIWNYCKTLSDEELARILDAGCNARENRRQKSPRALEHAEFTFEVVTDFGAYRDLHRHRILTQERQFLSCDYGFYTPPELQNTPYEEDYCHALNQAKEVFDVIAAELPEEAQYVVPMAYNIRWYFHVNLRALQWLCELRSSPAGHPSYRYIAQTMARQVCNTIPAFERFFKFVDYEGYELGRLDQEQRKVEKQQSLIQ